MLTYAFIKLVQLKVNGIQILVLSLKPDQVRSSMLEISDAVDLLTIYEVSEDANVHPVTTKYLESEKWKNNKIVKVEITFGIKVLLLEQMNGNFMT